MRLAAALTAVLLLLTSTHAPAAGAAAPDPVVLDGVTVHLRDGTGQVVTVNRTSGTHARLTYWLREGSHWVRKLQASGRIGYGGLVAPTERVQGSGTTPLGSYRLLGSFGTHDNPETRLSYREIGRGDFWVQDNRSDFYNRWRNRADGGFRWWLPASDPNSSERLTDYPVEYEYAINTSFNLAQVRHRGAGIFLHVNGDGATAGCVSGPRRFLHALFLRLDPHRVPMIAIGR